MSDAAQTIREMLDAEPLEEAVESFRVVRDEIAQADPKALSVLDQTIFNLVYSQHTWADPKKGSEALRFCLEIGHERNLNDGDTPTYLLIRAVEMDPDDDTLVLDYIGAVADNDYRYTDLSLLEIAQRLASPERARRLALLDTLCEFMVIRSYLDPPSDSYVAAMRRSFAAAVELGGDEAGWLDARNWVTNEISYAHVPNDLFLRYGISER